MLVRAQRTSEGGSESAYAHLIRGVKDALDSGLSTHDLQQLCESLSAETLRGFSPMQLSALSAQLDRDLVLRAARLS